MNFLKKKKNLQIHIHILYKSYTRTPLLDFCSLFRRKITFIRCEHCISVTDAHSSFIVGSIRTLSCYVFTNPNYGVYVRARIYTSFCDNYPVLFSANKIFVADFANTTGLLNFQRENNTI